MKPELTQKQKELLLSNKEDLKAIAENYLRHWRLSDNIKTESFDSFASQFQEKVEWKILSFMYRNGTPDLFYGGDYDLWIAIKLREGLAIHSVQYKSEAPLTVGDETDKGKITAFRIDGNKLWVCTDTTRNCLGYDISEVKKIERKVRFTTNGDNEEIFESDGQSNCYYFHINNPSTLMVAKFQDIAGYKTGYTYFKSKEKAEQYITLNAPKLSINECMNQVVNELNQWVFFSEDPKKLAMSRNLLEEKLVELVKQKSK